MLVVYTHACVFVFLTASTYIGSFIELWNSELKIIESVMKKARLTERQIQIQVKVLLTERILICAGVGQIRCGPVLNAAAA